MRAAIVCALFSILLLGARTASATTPSCGSVPECLGRLGLGRVDAKTAAVMGAIASPFVVVGAFVTAAAQKKELQPLTGVVVTPGEHGGKPRLQLALVPSSNERYTPAPRDQPKRPSDGAFKFNDTATTVMIAAG